MTRQCQRYDDDESAHKILRSSRFSARTNIVSPSTFSTLHRSPRVSGLSLTLRVFQGVPRISALPMPLMEMSSRMPQPSRQYRLSTRSVPDPRVSPRSFSRKNQSERTDMIENRTNWNHIGPAGFESGEHAHSNGAEAKKENVETTRSNELAEEEQETQQDPKPPFHNY